MTAKKKPARKPTTSRQCRSAVDAALDQINQRLDDLVTCIAAQERRLDAIAVDRQGKADANTRRIPTLKQIGERLMSLPPGSPGPERVPAFEAALALLADARWDHVAVVAANDEARAHVTGIVTQLGRQIAGR